jgi:hypothetical protein
MNVRRGPLAPDAADPRSIQGCRYARKQRIAS